jgi:hypothetical protein
MDAQTNLYLGYYKAQSGGELPSFNGARRAQYGGGLGDILRGLFRTLFPIAARGASTFLSETLKAKDAGAAGWGAAAKAAIAPTAQNVITQALDKVTEARNGQGQAGGRRHRRKSARRSKRKSKKSSKNRTSSHADTSQLGGRRRRGRKRHYKTEHSTDFKKIKFLNF